MLIVMRRSGFARLASLIWAVFGSVPDFGSCADGSRGLQPVAMKTESIAADCNTAKLCDERLFCGFIENSLIGFSRMFVIQTSLRLLVSGIGLLLLQPTLLQRS